MWIILQTAFLLWTRPYARPYGRVPLRVARRWCCGEGSPEGVQSAPGDVGSDVPVDVSAVIEIPSGQGSGRRR